MDEDVDATMGLSDRIERGLDERLIRDIHGDRFGMAATTPNGGNRACGGCRVAAVDDDDFAPASARAIARTPCRYPGRRPSRPPLCAFHSDMPNAPISPCGWVGGRRKLASFFGGRAIGGRRSWP
jgi:hypothetical protein